MKTFLRQSLWLLYIFLLSLSLVIAQGAACPELVSQALEAMDENCAATGRNQACYGYNQVETSFLADVDEEFFRYPGDLANISEIETIRTTALDMEDNTWGVALLNIQANLPNTLPGQTVTFILFGDVELENAVSPENAFEPSDGINVNVAAQSATIRSGAGANFTALGRVLAGDLLQADALSADNLWLRVIFNNAPAWIEVSAVAPDEALADLPILNDELYTPMQAVYLRTGIGEPECVEAPENVLLVQGPEDIEIQLSVNGASIRLGSTGLIRELTIDDEQLLLVMALEGEFNVEGTSIRPGEYTVLCLDEPQSRGLDNQSNDRNVSCAPTEPELMPPNEFNDAWCSLENLPVTVLNYAFKACYRSHTVAHGENLFRIAQHYCVTVDAFIRLNGISNPNRIVAGQSLFIPLNACEGEGSTQAPATNNPQAALDCSMVRLTSPRGGLPNGRVTFYWDPVPWAASYRLTISSASTVLATWEAVPPATNLLADVSENAIGGANPFVVELEVKDSNGNHCSDIVVQDREAAAPAQISNDNGSRNPQACATPASVLPAGC
jgi:hypothetical protein